MDRRRKFMAFQSVAGVVRAETSLSGARVFGSNRERGGGLQIL
jgi:hypothetical protein